MKQKLAMVLLGLAALPAFAVNFSGKWAIESPAGRGGGRGGPMILTLNHVGTEVTGTITPRVDPGSSSPVNTEILGGRVDGDTISFYVWTGSDQPAKTTYHGKIAPSGDEIEFTITGGRGGSGGGGTGQGGRGAGGGQSNAANPTQTVPAQPGPASGRGQPAGPQQVTARRAR